MTSSATVIRGWKERKSPMAGSTACHCFIILTSPKSRVRGKKQQYRDYRKSELSVLEQKSKQQQQCNDTLPHLTFPPNPLIPNSQSPYKNTKEPPSTHFHQREKKEEEQTPPALQPPSSAFFFQKEKRKKKSPIPPSWINRFGMSHTNQKLSLSLSPSHSLPLTNTTSHMYLLDLPLCQIQKESSLFFFY